MGAYSRSAGVGYREATPSTEVRLSAPPMRAAPILILLALVAAPAAEAKAPKLTVMTRNVYLGGNIAGPIPATDRADFERRASALWAAVHTTNFPARAKLLAREVKRTKPDLIGMQEVALWRRGADGVQDGTATPATIPVYDFLHSIVSELRRAGLRYRIASLHHEADLEAPVSEGYDVRLTMRDVVLMRVRKGLRLRHRLGANYKAVLQVPTAIGTLASRRGWTGADLALDGKRFRFLTTHLEAFSDDHRLRQAAELLRANGPVKHQKRVIVTGDINSDPTGATGAKPEAYRKFISAGLTDTWLSLRPLRPGFSCCFKQETIMDPPPAPFDHRVDHVFAKGKVRVLRGEVIGGDPDNRSPSGLWPSDHGGVVMTLRLR